MTRRHIHRILILALFATTSLVSAGSALAAGITSANNSTLVKTAPNGVPIVNIANPNAAGLSNNLFTDYNVDSKGVVLDNQDTSKMQVTSQLAGSITANTNLKSEATVILNQVVSTNRSTLAGYTELVGGSADVVVANPNGVTCNGCGFINIPKITLTTGAPVIANGGAGALTGFNVNAGDILITGQGLDASNTNYIGLFARSIALQGQVNAKYLDIIAGPNSIDYATKLATAQAGTGAAPTVAIDSSLLGGMYAARIRLIATEAGVGVRMLGDASAGAGDFTLTAAGKVDLQNHISAGTPAAAPNPAIPGNIQITSTDNSADSIKLTDANLDSQSDTTLTATSGNIHMIGSLLDSKGNLTLQSATLTDEFDTNSIIVQDQNGNNFNANNERYAAGALTLTQTGATTLDGTSFGAGGALGITAGSLSIGADGEKLYGNTLSTATTGALSLVKAALQSTSTLSLTSSGGQISTDSNTDIESTAGNVTITANNGFTNVGAVSADAGSLTTNVDGTLHNTGTLYAKTNALLDGYAGGATGTITNDGLIIGDNTLSTVVATLTNNGGTSNNGGMQGTKGGTISAATLTNSGTGLIIEGTTVSSVAYSGTVDASTLTNSGTIQSAKNLILNIASSLTNSKDILATGTGTLNINETGTGLTITNNAAGVLQAGTTLTTTGNGGANDINFNSNAGTVLGATLTLNNLASLSNTGTIQGGTGASTISVLNTLTNDTAGDIKLGTTSAGSGTISAGTIADDGVIESKGALTLYASNAIGTAATTGKIISDGDLTLRGLTSSNYTVNNNGLIQSTGGVLDIKGQNGGSAVVIQTPTAGAFFAGNTVNWSADTVSFQDHNSGVKSTGDLTIAANTFTFTSTDDYLLAGHNGTLTLANGLNDNAKIFGVNAMTVTAPNITITSTGGLASGGTLTAAASSGLVDNYGALYGGSQLTVNSANFTNEVGGTVNGGSGSSSFTQSGTFTNYSNINVNGNLTISSLYFINEIVGGDTRSWDYLHTAACLSNSANCFVPSESSGITSANIDLSLLPDGAQDPRAGSQLHDHDNWSDIQVNGWTNVDLAGNPTGGHNPYGSSCSKSGAFCSTTDYYLATFNVKQYYTGYTPTSANRPNLQAGGTLTVNNFQTGQNLGGLMSGGTVNISSNRFGATFTNDDLSLRQQNWEVWWDEYQSCDALNRCGSWQYRSYDKWITGYATLSSVGAGIYASGQLNMSGFSLYNNGSSFAGVSSASRGAAGSTGAPTTGTGSSVSNGTASGANAANTISFGGITITLPTNPNGYFIINPNPGFGPLIETNPQYQVGSSFLGPDYMVTTYGVNPDSVARQLGDANYDAYLIQQQVNNAGAAALLGTSDPGAAMQKLMDNGISTGKSLGLTIGVAPTTSQIAGLQNDMVWLVDTVVSGQHVLAPVVYLSEATKSQITSGAVIQASNVNMNLTSVTNTGGTIGGSNSLNMTTTGDITNTSGTITGGNVSLASTGGNITNQTIADFTNGVNGAKTATISSTGDLSLNAANNLTNTGAQLTAGGNANLNAGGDIDFNTIKDVQSTGSMSSSSGAFSSSTTTTVTTTVTNVGSGLTVGGNLTSNSGGNTTLTNANVNVTGNGSMTAGGNLNILDAQNTSYTSTSTSGSGLGVGGGIYGSQTTTDTDNKGTSAGSTVHFGGNGSLTANSGTVTLQGSTVGSGGNMDINAQTVNVLAGQNTDQHTHTVTTTTYLSMGSNSASGNSGSNSNYQPTQQQQNMGQVPSNGAGANANASETANGSDLSLVDHKTTTTTENTTTAVGSNLASGGNLTINSTGNTTLVGANVNAGGAANLNAGGDLNILAAQNTHTVTTTTEDTNVGFFTSSQNNANAGANAGYSNTSTGGANTNNDASMMGSSGNYNGTATAGANASSDNKLDLVRVDQSSSTTTDITHTGTTIHSGGNTTLGATNDINVAGSSVGAGGNLTVNAGNNLNVTAVQDSHTVTTSDSKTSAGLYADAGAKASASASGTDGSKYGGVDTQANGSASADANAGIGLYGSNTTSGGTSGSTTAIVSSLTSGGDMTRTANGTITDVGTNINAGGNFTQTAAAWNSEAAQNTTFSTTDSTTNTAKLGLYADAQASKSANYDQNLTTTGKDPEASVGVSASYDRNTSGSTSATSNAVVSNIHSGGSFTSTTTGATTMQGTNVSSGGDLTLNASSLDYKAAQNTTSNSNSNGDINVGLKVGKGTSGYTADLSGGASQLGTSSSSSTAVVGSLSSGGNLKVSTSGDQTYEGTNITAGKDATVESTGGNVTFNAAQNTTSSSKNYEGFTGDISGNQKGGSLAFDGGMNSQSSASSTAVVSTVTAGNGLTVKAKNDLTMQGTNLNSGGDTTLSANTLNYEAAQNTSSSSQNTQTLNVAVSGSKDGKGGSSGGGSGSYVNTSTSNSSSTAVVGNINAGGNLKVTTTGDQTYTGTNITAGKDATIKSDSGAVNFNQAENTSSSSSTQWGVSASGSSSSSKGGESKSAGAIGGGYQTNSTTTTTGVAGNIKTGGNLNVTSDKDLTLQGTNITSGGDAALQSNNGSVNFQALTSTTTGSGWGVNAGISGSSSSGGKGGDSSTKGGQVGGNYSTQHDVTETAGSITSGGNVTVKGNQDVTLVGTNVTSTGKTTLAATNGNVNIEATKSTQDDQSYAASVGISKTSSGSGSTAKNNTGYKGGVNVDVNETSTETGATIKAGSLDISSGKDTNMTGTNISTTGTGDTTINAGGNVNMAAAESTYGGVNLNVTMVQSNKIPGLSGGKILPPQNAGVKGGADYQGVNINSGGNLNVSSGGKTTMQATQVTTGGDANIDAAGGLDKTSTTSGGIDVGYKLSLHPTGTADLDMPSTSDTTITAKGSTNVSNAVPLNPQQVKTVATSLTNNVTTVSSQLQTSLSNILNNASLSTADKFKQLSNTIKNDPNLSQADKTAMLAALAKQQQSLGRQ